MIRAQDDGLLLGKGFCFSFCEVPGGRQFQARGSVFPLQGLSFSGHEATLQVCLRTGFLLVHFNQRDRPPRPRSHSQQPVDGGEPPWE